MAAFHEVPERRRSRLREAIARLRGEHTLERMRRAGVNAPGPVSMATRVYVDEMFAWAVTIGPHTRIASDVRIIVHDAAAKHLTGYTEVRPVVIGASCYVGTGAVLLPGSDIGEGAVIGAGAIVRGTIPPGSVAVGVPARVVGTAEDLRQRHLEAQRALKVFDVRPGDGLSSADRDAMREALRRDGRFYVR